jgi:hypothetical protein
MWSKNYKIIPRSDTTADLKKNTKHSSTAGKKIVITGSAILKKRPNREI